MVEKRENKYKIIVKNKAKKNLSKIPMYWQEKIGRAIDALEIDPLYGEKMWGKFQEIRKINIHPYRILYRVIKKDKIIWIERISHRGGVNY